MEVDNHIELGEILRPSRLEVGKQLCRGKIFQVFVIHDHINRNCAAFEILTPVFEGFKDG